MGLKCNIFDFLLDLLIKNIDLYQLNLDIKHAVFK